MNITHSQIDHIRNSIHQFVANEVIAGNGQQQTPAEAFKRLNALGSYALPYAHRVPGLTHYVLNQIEREILSQTPF